MVCHNLGPTRIERREMNGLIVVGSTIIGGFVGGFVGMVAAMFWADMDLASMDTPMYVLGGAAVGVVAGAYAGGKIVG